MIRTPIAGLALLGATLAGCAVGPDYRAPDVVAGERYTAQPLPERTAGSEAQTFAAGADIPAQWWTLFGSPQLQALVEQALKANPDIAAAEATLRAAHEKMLATASGLFPAIDGKAGASRQKTSGTSFGQPNAGSSIYNVFNASVGVSYTLDLFGAQRRKIESAGAQAEFQRFQLEAAYLTLSANVVTTAVRDAALRAQIEATQKIVDASRGQLEVLKRQFDLGGAAKTDVLTQQAELAQLQASLPGLRKQREQNRHLLAVLLGELPSQAPAVDFDLDTLKLPQTLPLSLPSKLVEQRPDVRAQAALLHQASAEVGVATANLLPQITLSASLGTAAAQAGNLFGSGTGIWSAGAGLTQPIFHAGELTHRRRAAVANYEQAMAQYRTTVNTAFQNVADTLTALSSDAETLDAQTEAYRAASAAHDIAQKQYATGAISYLALLTVERSYQNALIAQVQARAARYADTAALFQALGGGWWNRDNPAAQSAAASEQH